VDTFDRNETVLFTPDQMDLEIIDSCFFSMLFW